MSITLKTLIIFLFIFCYSFNIQAEEAEFEIVREDVLTSFNSLVKAAKTLNKSAYFKHLDKDKFIGLNSNGSNFNSISDLEPLINGSFDAIKEVKSLEFTNVKVSVIDAYTAILVNEFNQESLLKNGDVINYSGGGAQVWSKRSGEWKLVSFSASSKP